MAQHCYAERRLCRVLHMLSSTYIPFCAECHYAECYYAECRYTECRYAECHYAGCRGTSWKGERRKNLCDEGYKLSFSKVGKSGGKREKMKVV